MNNWWSLILVKIYYAKRLPKDNDYQEVQKRSTKCSQKIANCKIAWYAFLKHILGFQTNTGKWTFLSPSFSNILNIYLEIEKMCKGWFLFFINVPKFLLWCLIRQPPEFIPMLLIIPHTETFSVEQTVVVRKKSLRTGINSTFGHQITGQWQQLDEESLCQLIKHRAYQKYWDHVALTFKYVMVEGSAEYKYFVQGKFAQQSFVTKIGIILCAPLQYFSLI